MGCERAMHDIRYDMRCGAIIIADGNVDDGEAVEAVRLSGSRVVARYRWNDVLRLRDHGAIDLLVLDAQGVAPAMLDDALGAIQALTADTEARIVVALAADRIDVVAGHLYGRHVQLLCAPTSLEWVAALAIAGGTRLGGYVNEAKDGETARLRRLNEEVARIAETLARLTRSDAATPERPTQGIADRTLGFSSQPADDMAVTAQDLRQTIRARRLRQQFFETGLFEDPAWDMLLDLFAAEQERAQVSVSSLCIAAAVAPTTALRWIAKMTEAGLFARHPDPFDRRRAFMALSEKARAGMRAYCTAARRAGLPIA